MIGANYEIINLRHALHLITGMASGVEQLDRPEGKVIILGCLAAKNITNQTNIINLTNVEIK